MHSSTRILAGAGWGPMGTLVARFLPLNKFWEPNSGHKITEISRARSWRFIGPELLKFRSYKSPRGGSILGERILPLTGWWAQFGSHLCTRGVLVEPLLGHLGPFCSPLLPYKDCYGRYTSRRPYGSPQETSFEALLEPSSAQLRSNGRIPF